jgi:hypothetical protein
MSCLEQLGELGQAVFAEFKGVPTEKNTTWDTWEQGRSDSFLVPSFPNLRERLLGQRKTNV